MTTNIPAYTGEGLDDGSLAAPADWSGSDANGTFQFRFIEVDATSTDKANPNAKTAGQHDAAMGVLQNAPTSGEKCLLRFLGVSKVQAGGAISLGDQIASDANGNAVTAGTGDHVLGIALMPANGAKDIITALIFPTPVSTHA